MMEVMNEEKNRSFLNMNSHTKYGFAQEKKNLVAVSTMIQNSKLNTSHSSAAIVITTKQDDIVVF